MGVLVVQSVDVAEQHQQIRPAQPGHDGGQGVVVPQHLGPSGLDLGGGYRVVLIHHRDAPQLQQGLKGILQVLGPAGVVHILVGEEDLGHRGPVLPEEFVIDVHEFTLAYCGHGLLHPQGSGPLAQAQLAHTHADSPRGHQNDLVSLAVEVGQHHSQPVNGSEIHTAIVPGQGRGAHLDHHAQRLFFCHQQTLPSGVQT